MNKLYSIIWAVIFGFIADYLTQSSSGILNVIGYGAWIMAGLAVLTLSKSIGR